MYLLFFILIALVGTSFVNLTGFRLTVNQTPWHPRHSYCDRCHRQLQRWQLIPVVGFIIQRGHCHNCQQPINPFMFINEVLIVVAIAWLTNYDLIHDVELLIFLLTLVFLATTDYYAQIIYSVALLPVFIMIPLTQSLWFQLDWPHLWIITGTLAFLTLLSHGCGGLGFGDVELIMIYLLILGPLKTAIVILVASLLMVGWWLVQSNCGRMPFFPALTIAILFMI